MQARYANGHSAVTADASIEFTAEGVVLVSDGATQVWPYAEVLRSDDGNGLLVLKRKPDTGERIYISREDRKQVRRAAPALFANKARGIESLALVGALVGAAWALAAVFLLGVPLESKPIADVMPNQWRAQISEIEWSQVEQFTTTCDDSDEATRILNNLAYRLMNTSHVRQRDQVWVTIVRAPIPNAFTLPDNNILITDQLIALADQPDEVAGVLAHEIGHVELNHVMANVVRHLGAGVFFDVVFGGGGWGQAIALASVNISGLSFSRDDESAADRRGIDYLEAAGIDPGGLARLFDRVSQMQDQTQEPGQGQQPNRRASTIGTLLSNHPPTAERAALARARARPGRTPSLTDVEWRIVKRACGGSVTTPKPANHAPIPPAPHAPAPPQENANKP